MRMANPFTQSLMADLPDSRLTAFVARWDALEQLVIRVFRGRHATESDEDEWLKLRTLLVGDLAYLSEVLRAHWPGRMIGGKAAVTDPFAALVAVKVARDFVGNLVAMQTLPAAREALNLALIVEK